MIRLKELFRLENLKRLRLIAGQEGLERTVTAAVLLEYDSSRMELPDFYRGDLVVTTLAYARGDSQLVTNSLMSLLNQGIAGLLVKTAYFSELPASVVSMADKLGTPLFLFDETYIEEVILGVTDLIRGKRHFTGYEQELDALMRGALTADQAKEKVQRIDPTGCRAYRICALYPQERLSALEEKIYAVLSMNEALAQKFICMEWRRMLLILIHEEDPPRDCAEVQADIQAMLALAQISPMGLNMGGSERMTDAAQMGMALNEAVYAAKAARLTGRGAMCGQELGLYAYLYPMSENPFVCMRCKNQLQRIREYDEQNRTSLEQTARVYVDNSMEIAATAKALFQHPNTVRYRLTKIQKLMGMEDDALFGTMLSLLVNLSRILEAEGRN